jgi:pimeloyl-ACP methyl ester carboxylesterase
MNARVGALVEQGLIPKERPKAVNGDCSAGIAAILPAYNADPRLPASDDFKATTCTAGVSAATLKDVQTFFFADELKRFHGKALVFEGQADPFGPGWAKATSEALTGAQLERVEPPACGHFPWQECPQPFFAALEKLLAE